MITKREPEIKDHKNWTKNIKFYDRLDVWVQNSWCVGLVIELGRKSILVNFENLHEAQAESIPLCSRRLAALYSKTQYWSPVTRKENYVGIRKYAKKWRAIQRLKHKNGQRTPDELSKILTETSIERRLDELQEKELEWRSELTYGSTIDVLDCFSKWYSAIVIDVNTRNDTIKIHYDGYTLQRWDEFVGRRSYRVGRHFSYAAGGRESGGVYYPSALAFPKIRVEVFNDFAHRNCTASHSPVLCVRRDPRRHTCAEFLILLTSVVVSPSLRHLVLDNYLHNSQQLTIARNLNKSSIMMLTISFCFEDIPWARLCNAIKNNTRLRTLRTKLCLGSRADVSTNQISMLFTALRQNRSIFHVVYDVTSPEPLAELNCADIFSENIYIRTLNLLEVQRNVELAEWVSRYNLRDMTAVKSVLEKSLIEMFEGALFVPTGVARIIVSYVVNDRALPMVKWPALPRWFSFYSLRDFLL